MAAAVASALLILMGLGLAAGAWQRGAGPVVEVPQPVEMAAQAGPLAGWRIVVDPGHGGYDGGARCRDSGVWEKVLNLQVALAVDKALTDRGARVIMTRREDVDLTGGDGPGTKKRRDMQRRVDLAVEHRADVVLSIHMNEYRDRKESGPQVFYRKGCEGGRLLAGCLQEALITGLSPQKRRTAMAGDYFILQLDCPSALVECGFISNPAEERLLRDGAYQARLAEAVVEGVCEYARLAGAQKGPEGGV